MALTEPNRLFLNFVVKLLLTIIIIGGGILLLVANNNTDIYAGHKMLKNKVDA